jgi:hypothetical protein
MATTSNAAMNPYTRHLLASVATTQALRPTIEKAKAAEAASRKPVSQHLIERAKAMNARIRLRKLDAEQVAAVVEPAPRVVAEPANAKSLLARQSWRSFDFSCFDLQAIGAAYASGTPLRKLIPAEVPGYIFSEKLNSLGFKKGGK